MTMPVMCLTRDRPSLTCESADSYSMGVTISRLKDKGLAQLSYADVLARQISKQKALICCFPLDWNEQSRLPFTKPSPILKDFNWQSLLKRDGDELETHYRHVLESLGREMGMLGVIFRKAQNEIRIW